MIDLKRDMTSDEDFGPLSIEDCQILMANAQFQKFLECLRIKIASGMMLFRSKDKEQQKDYLNVVQIRAQLDAYEDAIEFVPNLLNELEEQKKEITKGRQNATGK